MDEPANDLLERVRLFTAGDGLIEQRQFGGNAFMLNGNMLCCISKTGMMARVGKDQEAEALTRPHARPFDRTGRRMGGLVHVDLAGLKDDSALQGWLATARNFVGTMPPKKKKR